MENKNDDEFEFIESYPIDDYHRKPLLNISLHTITESLGFESFNEKSKCSFDELDERRSRSRSNTKCTSSPSPTVINFPPLLSSLNEKGRPRFDLEIVRENGRLQIASVKNNRPEVIVERIRPSEESDVRVRIKFIDGKKDPSSSSSSSSSGKEEIIMIIEEDES
ncbi:uncharacterized protein LOC107030429 [Solanum pennellii]|uniref:Uncharacterized protein LOC107030429 n=1 Tax=Solanum pennellii TaxID=28526 RepID=A0ABM1HLB3_SOLPN|nr:uncharacterized protein LOC107030429 [Solanum pennellii]